MNGVTANLAEISEMAAAQGVSDVDVLICPPATLIHRAASLSPALAIGGQDCHGQTSGAHTGDTSAEQLIDAGARYVILGHSERRTDHGETNEDVHAKTEHAANAGLTCVVCIGETLPERDAGQTLDVVGTQLAGSIPDGMTGDNLVVAYEPVWAIGTGKVPTLEQIAEVHEFIRKGLNTRFGADIGSSVRILYGGSVKPSNAAEIFSVTDVDGALVGGASLKASDFNQIIQALSEA